MLRFNFRVKWPIPPKKKNFKKILQFVLWLLFIAFLTIILSMIVLPEGKKIFTQLSKLLVEGRLVKKKTTLTRFQLHNTDSKLGRDLSRLHLYLPYLNIKRMYDQLYFVNKILGLNWTFHVRFGWKIQKCFQTGGCAQKVERIRRCTGPVVTTVSTMVAYCTVSKKVVTW